MRLWPYARRYVFDVLVVVGAVGSFFELLAARDDVEGPHGASVQVIALASVGITLPLLLRRRLPVVAPTAVFVIASAVSFVQSNLVSWSFFLFLAVLSSVFLFGVMEDRRWSVAGLGMAFAAAVLVTINDEDAVQDAVFVWVLMSVVWVAGFALSRKLAEARAAQERAAVLERDREDQARRAVAEERQRIARELHDVVAHSVSVMTVQAGGVRRLLRDDQQREREALEQIEKTGREALAEMRRLLGILRQPTEQPELAPQPGMERLSTLIQQVREAGLPVEYRVRGEPVPLPPGIDVSAYRIVQEALTNALKHAGPGRAQVDVSYGSDVLELEIVNDAAGNGRGEGAGQGLVGMRERVALYGGKLESGPRDGRFVVRARLPMKEAH